MSHWQLLGIWFGYSAITSLLATISNGRLQFGRTKMILKPVLRIVLLVSIFNVILFAGSAIAEKIKGVRLSPEWLLAYMSVYLPRGILLGVLIFLLFPVYRKWIIHGSWKM